MSRIDVVHLTKSFGATDAVRDVSFEVKEGELVTVLGPSGCGKTTTLRLIAGLERADSGEVRLGGEVVTSSSRNVPPEQRNLGMVFQTYAVWPHMTAYQNVAFPLRMKKLTPVEIHTKVTAALRTVGLDGHGDRYPGQLSGGEQQRVALARALAAEPKALLFDEPLSNLDAVLRERMRFEIRELQRRVGFTGVYVTHDQAEATVLSDKIVVMNDGRVVQSGEPLTLYLTPRNSFVATFFGLANLIPIIQVTGQTPDGLMQVVTSIGTVLCRPPAHGSGSSLHVENSVLCVRPEHLVISPPMDRPFSNVRGVVSRRTYLVDKFDYAVRINDAELRVQTGTDIVVSVGDVISLGFDPNRGIIVQR